MHIIIALPGKVTQILFIAAKWKQQDSGKQVLSVLYTVQDHYNNFIIR